MTLFNLESLINTPTCFQSEKRRCIDLILTNKKSLFKNSKTFEDGISDHHQLVSTSLSLNTFRVTQRPSSTEITNLLILNLLIMN